MTKQAQQIRQALLTAADDLLEGRIPGPLTGVRLVEAAGVKRHRLTHDNPDINADFQERARAINHTKPEVENLRKRLDAERARSRDLAAQLAAATTQLQAYAAALAILTEERDQLRSHGHHLRAVPPITDGTHPAK